MLYADSFTWIFFLIFQSKLCFSSTSHCFLFSLSKKSCMVQTSADMVKETHWKVEMLFSTQKRIHKDQALGRLLSECRGCVNFKSQALWEQIEAHFWYSSPVGSEIPMKKVSHALFAKLFAHSQLPQFIFLQWILICFKK